MLGANEASGEVSHGDLAKARAPNMRFPHIGRPRHTVIFIVGAPKDPMGNATRLPRLFIIHPRANTKKYIHAH